MKHILATSVVGLTIALSGTSAQAATLFQAVINSSQEVPPNSSTATGFATLALNDAQDRLTISVQLNGLDLDGLQTPDPNDNVTSFHIHRGPFGVNGPVVFGLISPNSDTNGDLTVDPINGTVFSAWDLSEGNNTTLAAELPNLFNEGLYFNVHTVAFPGGEIRGQITTVPESQPLNLLSGLLALGIGIGLKRKLA